MYFAKNVDVKVDPTELLQNLITLYFDHDYDSICKILKIEKSNNHKNNIPSDKYYKKGMTFCEDKNHPIQVRIYVDEEIRQSLNTLLLISSNLIDEKIMTDLIINKWINKVGVVGMLKNNNTTELVGNKTYIRLNVGKEKWNDFLTTCKNKGIPVKIGFKMALLNFFNQLTQKD